jgi:hypothetical protein
VVEFHGPEIILTKEPHVQIKTRVAGVLAATAAAVALIGGTAHADNAPNVGNVTGI